MRSADAVNDHTAWVGIDDLSDNSGPQSGTVQEIVWGVCADGWLTTMAYALLFDIQTCCLHRTYEQQ